MNTEFVLQPTVFIPAVVGFVVIVAVIAIIVNIVFDGIVPCSFR